MNSPHPCPWSCRAGRQVPPHTEPTVGAVPKPSQARLALGSAWPCSQAWIHGPGCRKAFLVSALVSDGAGSPHTGLLGLGVGLEILPQWSGIQDNQMSVPVGFRLLEARSEIWVHRYPCRSLPGPAPPAGVEQLFPRAQGLPSHLLSPGPQPPGSSAQPAPLISKNKL